VPYFFTDPPLGYVGSYTLNSLPPGFTTGYPYVWDMWVYSPDGGYGISYWAYYVTFSTTGLEVKATERPSAAAKSGDLSHPRSYLVEADSPQRRTDIRGE
jgi:hypothetical protein